MQRSAGVCQVMEKVRCAVRGRNLNWTGQKFILSLSGVVGISRHDGFYVLSSSKNADANKTRTFDGTDSSRGLGVLGRSQKVLQRIEKDAFQPLATNRQLTRQPKARRTCRNTKHGELHTESLESALLQQIREAQANGKTKTSLKLCLDILESTQSQHRDFNSMALHGKISQLASQLKLLSLDADK